jgi:hypothetical protein
MHQNVRIHETGETRGRAPVRGEEGGKRTEVKDREVEHCEEFDSSDLP